MGLLNRSSLPSSGATLADGPSRLVITAPTTFLHVDVTSSAFGNNIHCNGGSAYHTTSQIGLKLTFPDRTLVSTASLVKLCCKVLVSWFHARVTVLLGPNRPFS